MHARPDPEPRLASDPIDAARENWARHGWSDAVPGMGVVTAIMRVQQLALSEVERILRPHGLTFARYEVLMLLSFSRAGSLPIGKVGERLQVHPASVTNAVSRLEHDRLVERSPNPADGRGVMVTITDAGRELALAVTEELNELVFRAWPLSTADSEVLYDHLKQVRRAFGDFA
ncbi:MAG: MarR family transcriptional regulator [Ilumatobacteraceae bacterium]